MRLDHYIYLKRHTDSRNRAKTLICDGAVSVDGKIVTKPAFEIDPDQPHTIEILCERLYVSRAALKLKHFLRHASLSIEGKRCLDIGSSRGGFVEVLLEKGAASVTAVDVGTDQLHPTLRSDARVRCVEQTDIRDFDTEHLFDLVTCDVSFVGIRYILPDIDRLASRDIVLLFKPQFEVGREVKRTKKGVVKDGRAIDKAKERFLAEATALGWHKIYESISEIKGKEGNVEIFFHFQKR